MNKLASCFLILLVAPIPQLPIPSMAQNSKKIKTSNKDSARSSRLDCLPEGFALTDIVSYGRKTSGKDENITIERKLVELKARCKEGRLLDGKGREIRFFKPACFGNPPADYDEIRQKESEELDRLQKDYNVIVLECDPRIM